MLIHLTRCPSKVCDVFPYPVPFAPVRLRIEFLSANCTFLGYLVTWTLGGGQVGQVGEGTRVGGVTRLSI